MNSKTLAQWLTIASNIGVLFGLVLLLVELNQNSRIASAPAHLELAKDRREIWEYADSMFDIDSKFRFGEEVTAKEGIISGRLYEVRIRSYETQWHFWRNGLIDDA